MNTDTTTNLNDTNVDAPIFGINEILQLNANDVLRIRTNRTANNSTVRFNGGRTSSFSINKLK